MEDTESKQLVKGRVLRVLKTSGVGRGSTCTARDVVWWYPLHHSSHHGVAVGFAPFLLAHAKQRGMTGEGGLWRAHQDPDRVALGLSIVA